MAGESLGSFPDEPAARAAWAARASGRPAHAVVGDWTIGFGPDGRVYRLLRNDTQGSGENQRPPQ